MTPEAALRALEAHVRITRALELIQGRLNWDQETVMPRGAAEQRAEEAAALETIIHERWADPQLAEWLDRAQSFAQDSGPIGAALVRETARRCRRATRVPVALAAELARVTARAQGIWAEARARDDAALFLPWLERIVALKREEAQALKPDHEVYDALLDEFEPGARTSELVKMFDRLRSPIVALRARLRDAHRALKPLKGDFPAQRQLRLARLLAERFGYDFARGRLDLSVHPFSSGSGADVRITTRVDESDPFPCLFATLHEVGHATYEQGVDPALWLTPLGQGASMAVHESQARLYENQLGRSRAFCTWLFGALAEEFGAFGVASPEALFQLVNRVSDGFIRTEADELSYNLHIMLRFSLERALLAGELAVSDLEAAWNDRFFADFGVRVDRPSNGFLQDVHWSVGLFGYFPTYTLGTVYAGCFFMALERDHPRLRESLARGDPSPALQWLKERVHRFGALNPPRETVAAACGFEPDERPLLAYFKQKFCE